VSGRDGYALQYQGEGTQVVYVKENPADKATFAMYGPGQAIWTKKDYARLAEASYQSCATAFACAKLIGQTASRIEWLLYDRRDNEILKHPLLDLLNSPNERESGIMLTEKVFIYLLLAGNAYVAMIRGRDSAAPSFLYALRPDKMRAISSGDWRAPIGAWRYENAGVRVDFRTADIIHFMEFHPTDDVYGLSRIGVASRLVDISNQAQEWNKKLLQNDMRPSGVMNFKDTLTPEERDEFELQMQGKRAGFENAGRILITEGEAEWTQMSMNAKDIDWLNGQKYTMRQICSIFGVASELLGDSENKTYSNYGEARRALYEETVLPLMDLYRSLLRMQLVPAFGDGLRLEYDRDSIEALQEERSKKYAYLAQADWLTINEKREATDYDQITEGDVLLVPISSVPLIDTVAGAGGNGHEPPAAGTPPAQEPVPPVDEPVKTKRAVIRAIKKSFWTDKNRRSKLWEQFDQRATARARTFGARAVRYLQRQADEVRARVLCFNSPAAVKAESLFNVEDESKRFQREFRPWYVDHAVRAGNAGLRATRGELFDDSEMKDKKPASWTFDLKPAQEERLMQMVFNSGTKVNQTTIDIIYNCIRKAQEENATIDWLAENIWEQVDQFAPGRASLWADTEATKVDNWATLEGYKENEGVEGKGWNCQKLPTSRAAHIAVDGQQRKLDEPFDVGGEQLMFPGDPVGSPENVCRCRCSQYPVVFGD